jgi:hypothetical protein
MCAPIGHITPPWLKPESRFRLRRQSYSFLRIHDIPRHSAVEKVMNDENLMETIASFIVTIRNDDWFQEDSLLLHSPSLPLILTFPCLYNRVWNILFIGKSEEQMKWYEQDTSDEEDNEEEISYAKEREKGRIQYDTEYEPYECRFIKSCVADYTVSVSMLEWAGPDLPVATICKEAAKRGNLLVLQWARNHNPPCPWDEETCHMAAFYGHVEILQWVRSQTPPCPWNAWTCSLAAFQGDLEVLLWLRSQYPPCPWNEETCDLAARENRLETLQWLRKQNPPCPWHELTCVEAMRERNFDVLDWARSQDPPCPWNMESMWEALQESVVRRIH